MYVIKRTDQGGGYVAKSGLMHSYTRQISLVRRFATIEEAESNRCPENEIIVCWDEA